MMKSLLEQIEKSFRYDELVRCLKRRNTILGGMHLMGKVSYIIAGRTQMKTLQNELKVVLNEIVQEER